MGRVPSFPGEGGLVKLDHPTEGSLTASPRWSGGVRHRRRDESGQAMVEFALILFPLILLVSGIIWFGIGLNFWLDMNRISNQGARWAVVNCGPAAVEAQVCPASGGLQGYLEQQTLSKGNNPTVLICYEAMTGPPVTSGGPRTATVGDPVTVRLSQPFELVPFLGIDTTLQASTTMRLEQEPTKGGLSTKSACP